MKRILQTALAMLAVNLVALAGWWLFYRTINSSGLKLETLRREISTAEAKQKNIKALAQTLGEISEKKSEINRVFVDEKSVIKFIEALEEMASVAGVSMEIPSASLPAKIEDGGPSFTLNLEGSFGRLFRFLSLVEKMDYQLKAESARFSVPEDADWNAQIKIRLASYNF